jgi:hypothetical protein
LIHLKPNFHSCINLWMLSLRSPNGGSRNASSNGVIIFWVFLQVEIQPKQWLQDTKEKIDDMMNPQI